MMLKKGDWMKLTRAGRGMCRNAPTGRNVPKTDPTAVVNLTAHELNIIFELVNCRIAEAELSNISADLHKQIRKKIDEASIALLPKMRR